MLTKLKLQCIGIQESLINNADE